MENFDELKHKTDGTPKYKLSSANVFVSEGGFHYVSYLDPMQAISPIIDGNGLTDEEINYIEKSLQSNPERIENQVDAVKRHVEIKNKRVLDIGCGGGLFLSKMKAEGAKGIGIELSDSRAYYAQTKHGLDITKRPIEDNYWENFENTFDVVTLWDVIEHVNFPLATLKHAVKVLKPNGILLIDTPCRDAFYHRFGEFTYKISGGRFPTFLNAMYSSKPFGHKQILSLDEMKRLFESVGLEVLELETFHELSFPYSFYLKKFFRSDVLVKILLPLVHIFFVVFPIRNKMLAIGRKN
ncbi:MAG: methyltransferase domain-containing protein [Anaerolineales bacterium]|nr:methyltransferase domain-containing protein [Anaerolineales bacterium]